MRLQFLLIWCVLSIFLSTHTLDASKRKPFSSIEAANNYLVKCYNQGCSDYNEGKWRRAADNFEKVIYFFPCSEEAAEASYYLGVCYFEMQEFDFANEEFSSYLKASIHPEFFEDVIYYKFCIAERLKQGHKRRPFKFRYAPKWSCGQDLALSIYDEVIAALPNHQLTIQSLYAKADLLRKMREFRAAIDTYQVIIKRFPKDEMTPICYLEIASTYYQQSLYEFQNPDILALAELNLCKFKEEFPTEERIEAVENEVARIKETYAKGLCNLGLFYERRKQPAAAAIYYQSCIEEFPDTYVGEFCRSRLICLGYKQGDEEHQSCLDSILNLDFPVEDSVIIDDLSSEPINLPPAEVIAEEKESQEQNQMNQPERHSKDLFSYPYIIEEINSADAEQAIAEGMPVEVIEEQCEPSPTYIHYSLTKKRDVKYVPPKH